MRSFWILTLAMAAVFLALFGVVEFLQIPLLTDPQPWLSTSGAAAALIGVGLLIADVLLPVPASLVMIAHGALFGVFWGALISTVGSLGAAVFGFSLGRWGSPWAARFLGDREIRRARDFLARWGDSAVVASRPVPILAETLSIAAGAAGHGWIRFLLAALLGNLPACLLYAATGASAADFGDSSLIFLVVLLIAGAFWMVGRRLTRPQEIPARRFE